MKHNPMWLWGAALAAAGALAAPALPAQVAPAAPAAVPAVQQHASLFEVVAVLGRQRAHALEGPLRRGTHPDAGAASNAAGLALAARGQTDSALTALRAAVTASPDVARYRGDLAFALASASQFDQAEQEYRAAVQLQGANAWYYVGLGAAQVAQQHWTQAAASFSLAVATDSAVIVRPLIGPAGDAFQNANMREQSEEWSRMATTRFPDEPLPWLRLASYAYLRHDTAAGLPLIRRYRAEHPEDHSGEMLYAEYLLVEGKNDSAATLAMMAAADSGNRTLAASVLYNAGGHYIASGSFDSAVAVLQRGRTMAPPQFLPQFDLYIGISRLRQLQRLFNEVVASSDCRRSTLVDTMLTSLTAEITAGVPADSATANQVLGVLPRYRQSVDNFKKNCGH